MFSFLLPKTQCHACSNTIDKGHFSCSYCGRSRLIGIKQWEFVFISFFALIFLSLCISSSTLIFRPPNTPIPSFTQIAASPNVNTPRKTPTKYKTPIPTRTEKKITPTSTDVVIGYAKISGEVYRVNLRRSPGYLTKDDSVDVIVEIPTGSTVKLLRGPQKVDGLQWWYVEWNGYKGWVAERTASGKKILIIIK